MAEVRGLATATKAAATQGVCVLGGAAPICWGFYSDI